MSYNGSGTFNINTSGQPVVTGTVISSTAFNALTADLATGLSTAITKDGQTIVTANIPFNTFKLTGIGVATATGDALTYGQAATVTTLVASTSITDAALTSGRVTYAGASGLLQDSANLTFNGTTLTANTIGAFTLGGTVAGGGNQLNNVVIGTTTPLAGAFTTLSATGTITSSGGFIRSSVTGAVNAVYSAFQGGIIEYSFGLKASNSHFVINNGGNFGGTDLLDISSTGLAVSGNVDLTAANTFPTTGMFLRAADNQLKICAGSAGIAFAAASGASTLATLDSSGNLGLGVTPSAWSGFKVFDLGNYSSLYNNNGNNSSGFGNNLYYNGTNWIYKNTGSASLYSQVSGVHTWYTAPSGTGGNAFSLTQAMTLGSTGLAVTGTAIASTSIGVGNTTPSGGGAGIAFPATQSASTDANTLDDYEEGTWTPSIGGTATYTAQQGTYRKVGSVVFYTAYVQINSLGTGTTAYLSGLPFSTATTSNWAGSAAATTAATNIVSIYCLVGSTQINLYSRTAASASPAINAIWQNGALVEVNGFYFV